MSDYNRFLNNSLMRITKSGNYVIFIEFLNKPTRGKY